MLMSLRIIFGFLEFFFSSLRNISVDNLLVIIEYLKMVRKGGGCKGMVCLLSIELNYRNC